jgi:hypothetical protein
MAVCLYHQKIFLYVCVLHVEHIIAKIIFSFFEGILFSDLIFNKLCVYGISLLKFKVCSEWLFIPNI